MKNHDMAPRHPDDGLNRKTTRLQEPSRHTRYAQIEPSPPHPPATTLLLFLTFFFFIYLVGWALKSVPSTLCKKLHLNKKTSSATNQRPRSHQQQRGQIPI